MNPEERKNRKDALNELRGIKERKIGFSAYEMPMSEKDEKIFRNLITTLCDLLEVMPINFRESFKEEISRLREILG